MATIGTFLQRMQQKRLEWRKSKEQARQKPPREPFLQVPLVDIQPNDPTPEIERSEVETTANWHMLDEWWDHCRGLGECGKRRIVFALKAPQ